MPDVAIAGADDDAEGGWWATSLGVNDARKLGETRGALVDSVGRTELHLERRPRPVCQLDNRIDFEAIAVAVVKNAPAACLRMNPQVSDNQRLEEEAEEIEIAQELLR